MKQNLKDYIRTYKGIIPKDISEKAILDFNEMPSEKNTFYNYTKNATVTLRGDAEPDVIIYEKNTDLNEIVWNCIHDYITDLKFSWFNSWSGFSLPRVNIYGPSNTMAFHCDRIKSMFDGNRKGDPTLAVLGLLHSDFEGGKLMMFDEDSPLEFEQSDVIVFPSTFLYPHGVAPVTSGKRISFVSWVY